MVITSREIKELAAHTSKKLLDEPATERAILLTAYINNIFKTIEDAWDLDLQGP